MMNKNGSIKRVLLYILFFSVLIFVIYSLFLTFKEISNKNKTKVNNTSSIRMLDENTTFNPLDYIYSYGVLGYKVSDFALESSTTYTTNALAFESNSSAYFYTYNSSSSSYNFYNYTNNLGLIPYTSSISTFDYNNETRLSISDSLLLRGFSSPVSPSSIGRYTVLNSFASNLNNNRSFMVYYNCSIPLENFAFNFYYNMPLSSSTTSIEFYVLTDVGGWSSRTALSFTSSSNVFNFSPSNIISSLPSATKVIRFGFAIAQSRNSSNGACYLPQYLSSDSSTIGFNYYSSYAYQSYYNNVSNNQGGIAALNLLSIRFVDVPINPFYLEGYNTGYNDGLNYNQNTINVLNSQINSLNDNLSELRTTINSQSAIISQLQEQLNQQQSNFKDLFFTFTDIPIKTIHDVLNFEFFGLNLFKFFTGVITALGAIWLIKKFL